jgi:hypothetical protein
MGLSTTSGHAARDAGRCLRTTLGERSCGKWATQRPVLGAYAGMAVAVPSIAAYPVRSDRPLILFQDCPILKRKYIHGEKRSGYRGRTGSSAQSHRSASVRQRSRRDRSFLQRRGFSTVSSFLEWPAPADAPVRVSQGEETLRGTLCRSYRCLRSRPSLPSWACWS